MLASLLRFRLFRRETGLYKHLNFINRSQRSRSICSRFKNKLKKTILAFQNPEFKILADFNILAFQNHAFKILGDLKILAFQNPYAIMRLKIHESY